MRRPQSPAVHPLPAARPWLATCAVACLVACGAPREAPPPDSARLVALPSVETEGGVGAETVSIQEGSALLAVSNSERGTVEVYDLATPDAPARLGVWSLGLADGEEVTCVAVHPEADAFVAVVRGAGALRRGRLQAHSLRTGTPLGSVPTGVEPDSVYVDPKGRCALVADEAEDFVAGARGLESPPGGLTWVELDGRGAPVRAVSLALPDATGTPGLVSEGDWRSLEREVDGETLFVPLDSGRPELLEPEVVAFSPDGERAFVTLQENNGVVVVDTVAPAVLAILGLGCTEHLADRTDDGVVAIDEPFRALREPDGIAVTRDGRYFVTADEGDTDPKASDTPEERPCGGGRTLSVFRTDGRFVGDTGAGLDLACAAAGLYPDDRSDNRGCEPEMTATIVLGGRPFALVTLERADALALVDLSDPSHPRVASVAATSGPGPHAPEGLATYVDPEGRTWAYTANEESGRLGVFLVEP